MSCGLVGGKTEVEARERVVVLGYVANECADDALTVRSFSRSVELELEFEGKVGYVKALHPHSSHAVSSLAWCFVLARCERCNSACWQKRGVVTVLDSGVKGFSGSVRVLGAGGKVKIGRKGYWLSLRGEGAHSAQSLRQEGTEDHSGELG